MPAVVVVAVAVAVLGAPVVVAVAIAILGAPVVIAVTIAVLGASVPVTVAVAVLVASVSIAVAIAILAACRCETVWLLLAERVVMMTRFCMPSTCCAFMIGPDYEGSCLRSTLENE